MSSGMARRAPAPFSLLAITKISLLVFATMFILNCGGGGSGAPSTRTVSGKILAPASQIARNHSSGIIKRLYLFIVPEALADISGLVPVADNTLVELVRIFDSGEVASTIGSTRTSDGRYSFDLQALGVDYSSDLVVMVSGFGGVQMRSFVAQADVDINPITEAATRIIIEQIALTGGSSLADITIAEINDLISSIDLLSGIEGVLAGGDVETTVDLIQGIVNQDTSIKAFIADLAAPGQTSLGTGDVGNLFPLLQGDIWHFLIEDDEQLQPFIASMEVSGTKMIGSTLTKVRRYHNFENAGATEEEYFVKDYKGISYWGNTDSEDVITPPLVPFPLINFPATLGSSQQVIDRSGLTYPEDLDNDGQNETFDVKTTVTPVVTEAVSVPAGIFTQALRLETSIKANLKLSGSPAIVTVNEAVTEWLSPGVGVVKENTTIVTQGPGGTETGSSSSELIGYRVAGTGKGVLPKFNVIIDTQPANSDTTRPGRAGVASDGSSYLVVSCRDASLDTPRGLIGAFVSEHNVVSAEFTIATHDCQSASPSVAYDGTDYLVVFGRGGAVMGAKVSTSGNVGSEFLISPDSISNFGPRVAYDGNNYLIVWGRYVAGDYDIYGATVDPSGSVTNSFSVFSAAGEQVSPSIAFNGTHYLVTWRDTRDGSGPSLSTDVYGTRISSNGVVLDTAGIAIATASGYQGEPEVVSDGSNFFVVWIDTSILGMNPVQGAALYGKRLTTDGVLIAYSPSDRGVVINASPYGKGAYGVTFDGTNYLIVWRVGAFSNSLPAGLYAAHVSPAGVLLDDPIDSAGLPITGTPPDFTRFVYPTIASALNHSLLVWSSNIELSGQFKSVQAAYLYPW